jgi:flagellar basal-body rod protein FlgC
MSSILSIAASGMLAATQRLQVSAENVANVNSDGPLPTAAPAVQAQYPAAYVAQRLDQVETAGGGTRAVVGNVRPGTVAAYDPTAPYADPNGQVAAPNVDLANEAVQQQIARYAFAFNADVIRVYSKMMQSLLDVTA